MCRRPQKSFNYDKAGRRVAGFGGGHYLVPADEYACVLARRATDPTILNQYEFVPDADAKCASATCTSSKKVSHHGCSRS